VEVLIQDLYQLVRDRRAEPKIIFEPEGEVFSKVSDRIADIFLKADKRINLLFGSREGIPKGLFRFADLIVDLCPGITLSTEYAASSALIGVAFALQSVMETT
jgi:tRNA acetyltransferase TAN1